MKDPLASLYEPYKRELEAFDENWIGPKRYPHNKWVRVAEYEASDDGADVTIFCMALPARFYRIRGKGFAMSTGSGMADLTAQIAEAISNGMLVVETKQKALKA